MIRILFIIGLSVTVLLGYTFFEPYWLKVNKIDVRDRDIPYAFEGITIAFVTDIHHGPYFSRKRVRRFVEKLNHLRPDIVIFGGDYVHRDRQYIVPCFDELRQVQAPLGKFGVLGNHDHWASAPLTRQNMNKTGITILDNQATWIVKGAERIKIGGVGDLWEDQQQLSPTIGDTKEEDFVILVSHNPDYAEQLSTHQIDLMLSGHTHGGQVTLFGFWAPLVPSRYGQKYRSGIVETAMMKVIISTGIGVITPPVRFFARPEIILLTLKRRV
jgi:predicted MPP superfamily phosphohydrolase